MKTFLSVQLLVLAIFLAVMPRSADAAAVEHLEPRAKYCTASSQCNQELNHFCNYNRCAKKRPNGAFCYKNNGCWSGLCWQERSVCISAVNPRPLLAPCTASTQCETGNCKYKRCAKKVKNGRNCYKDANCRSGHCNKDTGKCQASHTAPTSSSSGAATILPTAQPESSSSASSTDVNTVLPTGVSSDISSASSEASSVIASATSELSSQIASATSEFASATSEAASQASSVIASATSKLSSDIAEATSAASDAEASATSAASDAEASATSAASDAEASATSAASDAEASATSAASDAEASATSAASEAEASATSEASEVEASASSSASDVVESLSSTAEDSLPTGEVLSA